MTSTPSATLARAKAGDQNAFADLVIPFRRPLLVHCYRILGSVQDAEDVLQEVLLSAWRALDQFDGASLKAWLYRIATNRSLNYLRDGARRPVQAATPQLGPVSSAEPWWLEPFPDALLDDTTPGPKPGTKRANPSHCRLWRACSDCRRSSAPPSSCGTFWAFPRPMRLRSWARLRHRSTAPCNEPEPVFARHVVRTWYLCRDPPKKQ